MALKKSPSFNPIDRLTSANMQVVAIDCQLRSNSLSVGLLCLSGSYRHQINEHTTVELIDSDNNPITTVKLPPTFQGEKNGYFSNTTLKMQ